MTTPPNEFASWVRNYVHYDNLTSQFTKQAGGARKLRDEFEDRIIQNLRTNNMQNAVIQIAGGRLQYAEEKTVPSLTIPRLEQYLHAYFKQKGTGLDETENILRYIKVQKANDSVTVAKLKKTVALPPLPPPPNSLK
jgi:hypothetical protein